ncbi:MAG: exodeoxyribonuclease VII small subunit [Candidatus Contendobacter sp.]|nr:exodeoxyribonuclease VII small subunit [Candidatus Contendobacter sp.]
MKARKNPPISFEAALAELESLVGQLEHGELALESSLLQFERGVALVRSCQSALRQAEQKVEQLIGRNGQLEPTPFDPAAG